MVSGGPFYCMNGRPFFCPNCHGRHAELIVGPASVDFHCRWCHSYIKIRMKKLKISNGGMCKSEMSVDVKGAKEVDFICSTCNSLISLKMQEIAPFALQYVIDNKDKKEFVERRE